MEEIQFRLIFLKTFHPNLWYFLRITNFIKETRHVENLISQQLLKVTEFTEASSTRKATFEDFET